jgi:hypothetical protein
MAGVRWKNLAMLMREAARSCTHVFNRTALRCARVCLVESKERPFYASGSAITTFRGP